MPQGLLQLGNKDGTKYFFVTLLLLCNLCLWLPFLESCHWLTGESKREGKLIFSKRDPFFASNLSWKTLTFTSGANTISNNSLSFAFASFTTFILVTTCIVSAAFFWHTHSHQIISSSKSRAPLKCSSIYWHCPSVRLGSVTDSCCHRS